MTEKAPTSARCGQGVSRRQPCLVNDISAPSREAKLMADTACTESTGAVTGGVRTLLRLEGLTLFAGMTLLYAVWDGSWLVYAILFLAPDLTFAASLAGPQPGPIIHNA